MQDQTSVPPPLVLLVRRRSCRRPSRSSSPPRPTYSSSSRPCSARACSSTPACPATASCRSTARPPPHSHHTRPGTYAAHQPHRRCHPGRAGEGDSVCTACDDAGCDGAVLLQYCRSTAPGSSSCVHVPVARPSEHCAVPRAGRTVLECPAIAGGGASWHALRRTAGNFVVTFPKAYHSGFSLGFNCGEAVR